MKTPIRASFFALCLWSVAAFWCLLLCFSRWFLFGRCFFFGFSFSHVQSSSKHLLQERFTADRVEIKCKVLRAHSLCQSKQFTEVKYGKVIFDTELLFDFNLAAVKLELTERADIGEGVNFASFRLISFSLAISRAWTISYPRTPPPAPQHIIFCRYSTGVAPSAATKFFHPGRAFRIHGFPSFRIHVLSVGLIRWQP